VIGSGLGPIDTIYQATIGWVSTCPVLSAELQAIKQAVDYIVPVWSWSYHNYIIATDSQDAIKAVKKGNTATKNREAL
jgi:ribonuclease HI